MQNKLKSKIQLNNESIQKFIQFRLGDDLYAIELLSVKEVIPVPETSKVPNAPSYYLGLTNLRGEIIPLIDFRKKLKTNTITEELEEAVIIVENNEQAIGLIVDSIIRVLVIPEVKIDLVSSIKSHLSTDYINGIYNKDREMTIILDLDEVLNTNGIQNITKQVS